MVRMTVHKVGIHPSQKALVILADDEERRLLPIIIGMFEAQAIAMGISGEDIGRPLTHDLLLSVINELEGELERIEITRLSDTTYYALLHIVRDGERLKIDARPSDAIALALRANCQIYVAEEVLDVAAVVPESVVDEENLEKFKDLVDKIDLDEDSLE